MAEDPGEAGELKGVEVEEGGLEVKWVARAKAVGELWEGETVAE